MNKVKKIKDKKIIVKNIRIEREVEDQITELKRQLEKLHQVNVSQNDIMRIALTIGLEKMIDQKKEYNAYELMKAKSNFLLDENEMIKLFEILQENTVKDSKRILNLSRNNYLNYMNRLKLIGAVESNGALKKVKFLMTTDELKKKINWRG